MVSVSADPVVQRRGSLEITSYARSKDQIRLVTCPFCEYDFDEMEHRWLHFPEEHDPEDAGLSPLGETPEATEETGGVAP